MSCFKGDCWRYRGFSEGLAMLGGCGLGKAYFGLWCFFGGVYEMGDIFGDVLQMCYKCVTFVLQWQKQVKVSPLV